MDFGLCYKIIETIAEENEFVLDGTEKSFTISQHREHPEAFLIEKKVDTYLVYQWEKSSKAYGSHSIYSLRNISDTIKFCNIIMLSSEIRAGRDKV